MIAVNNLKSALLSMGFAENGTLFEKSFSIFGCSLAADFSKSKLIYPQAIKGRDRNDDFDAPENFVVFECVNRLLEKGYRPEDIELEKEWHLGHDAKGGRADICVSYNGEMLFIIECKRAGREFEKAYKDTQKDGGQLFSYWQQERATKWLVLYTSDYSDGAIQYKAPTISCSDDKNIEQLAIKDTDIKLYKNAFTAEQKFLVWRDTYFYQFFEDLIFHADTKAYEIGIRPLFKKDLHDFSPEDKIVNRFEEILRHNNVSDKENAFNRLVALFICKLVDESTKAEDDAVDFQYIQGTDTYESLQDRLQRLHTEGMEKFMREKIFYVPNDYPEKLFQTYTGHQRKKAIEDLRNTIRILKFYSNNDFSFKDVHNEELFYQNGKVLVEVVKLFEQYRIVYPSKHQFLGDLFEQLLSKGFKQNEGQFFTPMPITRFIWDSLPVYNIVHTEQGFRYPKIIDYSCGAGHFLTEAVEAVNAFAVTRDNNGWVRDHIFGIEKDYRLARVSKISMFMNGAGEANIVFGDGLENQPEKGIENGIFDILVANPPYSVKDFKQHLQLKSNNFELLDCIGDNGSEIEVLFVERIAKLLRPNGIAAVILPSSILSNDSASYTGAREQLLQNFKIHAIVQFGSKTFGATGTNTVVLFLEKYNEPPKRKDMIRDSVSAILAGADLTDWEDKDIFEAYTAQTDISQEAYISFAKEEMSLTDLSEIEHFKTYVDVFLTSRELAKLEKTRAFLNLSEDEQIKEINRRFYAFAKNVEQEKLFYFALLYRQHTLIITAPADNEEQKEFLGYDWSNRKGAEGIRILSPGGNLYNDADRTAEGTLAYAIRQSFTETLPELNESNSAFADIAKTADMLDYSRFSFNKAIRTRLKKEFMLPSKYKLKKLINVCDVDISKSEVRDVNPETLVSFVEMASVSNDGYIMEMVDRKIGELRTGSYTYFFEGDIIIAKITPCMENGKCAIASGLTNNIGFGSSEFHTFRCHEEELLTEYLFALLNQRLVRKAAEEAMTGASGHRRVPASFYEEMMIPVPLISIQQQVVDEISAIDNEFNVARMSIEDYRKEIEDIFDGLDTIRNDLDARFTLSDKAKFDVSIGKRVLNSELVADADIPVFSANVFEPFGYIDKLLIEDFSLDSILWGIDGDWMVNFYGKEHPFYPTDHCGVLRVLTDKVNPRYMAHILEIEGKKMSFSRNYRASIDRVEGIAFTVPKIEVQDKAMEQIIALEQKIIDAEAKLETIAAKKEAVLKRFLE